MRLSPAFFFGWRRLFFPGLALVCFSIMSFKWVVISCHFNVISMSFQCHFNVISMFHLDSARRSIRKSWPSSGRCTLLRLARLQNAEGCNDVISKFRICHRMSCGPREPSNSCHSKRHQNFLSRSPVFCLKLSLHIASVDFRTQTHIHNHTHTDTAEQLLMIHNLHNLHNDTNGCKFIWHNAQVCVRKDLHDNPQETRKVH